MGRPFRFAVQAMDLGDRAKVAALARQAEALGYEELYSFDHLGAVDPFAPLLVAAEATSHLRVRPLVLNNEFHHTVLLARTAATVDRMTGGRLILGIGTGYAKREHDALGPASSGWRRAWPSCGPCWGRGRSRCRVDTTSWTSTTSVFAPSKKRYRYSSADMGGDSSRSRRGWRISSSSPASRTAPTGPPSLVASPSRPSLSALAG